MDVESPKEINHFRFYFLILLIVFSLYLCFKVFNPFLEPIFLAACIASVFSPFYLYLEKKLPGKPALNSTISCGAVLLIVILPLLYILFSLGAQGVEAYGKLNVYLESEEGKKLLTFETWERIISRLPYGKDIIENYSFDIKSFLQETLTGTLGVLQSAIASIAGKGAYFVFKFIFMIIALWMFFHSGRDFLAYLLRLLPLSEEQEIKIVDEFRSISSTTFIGTFGTALILGSMGGILFWFYGFSPLLIGVSMAFASLIPVVGMSLIWLPITIFLFISDNTTGAIILFIICPLISLSENIFRPLLMKGGTAIHPGILLFCIIGGLLAFGFFGMIYGPITVAITKIVLDIYYDNYGKNIHEEPAG